MVLGSRHLFPTLVLAAKNPDRRFSSNFYRELGPQWTLNWCKKNGSENPRWPPNPKCLVWAFSHNFGLERAREVIEESNPMDMVMGNSLLQSELKYLLPFLRYRENIFKKINILETVRDRAISAEFWHHHKYMQRACREGFTLEPIKKNSDQSGTMGGTYKKERKKKRYAVTVIVALSSLSL